MGNDTEEKKVLSLLKDVLAVVSNVRYSSSIRLTSSDELVFQNTNETKKLKRVKDQKLEILTHSALLNNTYPDKEPTVMVGVTGRLPRYNSNNNRKDVSHTYTTNKYFILIEVQ